MKFNLNQLTEFAERAWDRALTFVSQMAERLMSSRSLAICTLICCGFIIVGPWMRSSISRDFRAIHIPWIDFTADHFLPEYVAMVPRAWRWDSIAVPLFAVVAAGLVAVVWRPQWTSRIFGLLLAISIPALGAALWNHPGLIEFFEGEIEQRSMLRIVYTQQSEDAMSGRAPDRLQTLGEKKKKKDVEAPVHPIVSPFHFSMYGTWLIITAFVGTVVYHQGTWSRRITHGAAWAGAGMLAAAIVTAPRWVSEYHWARAEAAENTNRFADAEQSMRSAVGAMPSMAYTSRYWLMRGRLEYRQRESSPFASYFLASQFLATHDVNRARQEIEHSLAGTESTTAQRVLLAQILGRIATEYASRGKYGAAELSWNEAAKMAPWIPAYWIGESVCVLAADPTRADEVRNEILPRLDQIGDCFISCDFASMLGDAYFEDGQFYVARDMYSEAMALFQLPKYVNLHAQEGRLGM